MASTPQYIFELLQTELYEHNKSMLTKLCDKNGLDKDRIFSEYLTKKLQIVGNEKILIEVTKKISGKKLPTEESRCMARVWNRGKGGQCSRCKGSNSDYCLQHNENRKHGRIDEKVPREIFQNKSNSLYKG